ncbi:hypothetical protein C9374_011535 [Naegleria lovaniensis]|uniref:Cyclin-dependent kinases regulatory subunit n=1 Tax=Naegleria lovaniensis TaxID=51637 RepID=A0AA88GXI6_NAELO|nr:uncharacterized protein C9374_011535 [Naegleria lovaniensis]KAG2392810.1 hypothetical protein C9374_011535 [Naegleria lovaniensis]
MAEHDISKEINYSDKYYDDQNEYRHVTLPRDFGNQVYKHFGGQLLSENEWRSIGIEMSRGWVHYGYSPSEHHILLFYRKYSGTGVTPRVRQEQQYQKIIEERDQNV